MFYSHQLLCKKGPLGQIWIAATMHAKINRKKTEQIDIEEICMQILQPQVPLALRLSGILMGGVVLVFHRKVKFLQDDVTEFLLKIKTAMSKKPNDYIISLPKGKSKARYENVTINYNFDVFDDIERPMMRPSTPEQHDSDRDMLGGKDYIIIAKPRPTPHPLDGNGDLDKGIYLGPDHLRVDSEDITLDDNNPSSNDQFGDFGMDILEERFPATEHDPMDIDTFLPEILLSDEIKPPLSTAIPTKSTDSQDPLPEQDQTADLQKSPSKREEPVAPESPQHVEATAAAAPAQKKRKRRVQGKFNALFDEDREISASLFTTWLRNTEDLTGRKKGLNSKDSSESKIEALFRLPSASLSRRSLIPQLAPDWTDQLTNLWDMTFVTKSQGDHNIDEVQRKPKSPEKSPTLLGRHAILQDNQVDSKSHSDPSHGQPGEFDLSSPSETRANPEAEKIQKMPIDGSKLDNVINSVEHLRFGQLDLREYGSVEKLRAALRSPSIGSEDHFGGSQVGLTPSHSGQLGTNNSGRPGSHNRRLSTPGSAKLPFDIEVEPFTDGFGRFKKPRLSSPAVELGDLPADTYFADNDMPPLDALGSSDYFATLRGTLRGPLTQFDLLEETAPSAQGSGKQQEGLNNVSGTVLQCLRQNFIELGAQCKEHQSLNGLAQGMDRSQAAKLFYQILVLRSNSYLDVSQDVPFGDILLSRGPYL